VKRGKPCSRAKKRASKRRSFFRPPNRLKIIKNLRTLGYEKVLNQSALLIETGPYLVYQMISQDTRQIPTMRHRPVEPVHFVQFYENDSFIIEKISRRAAKALKIGGSCVLVATGPHLADLEARLHLLGMDLESVRAQGRYVALDAADTLAGFMVDGAPDRIEFNKVVGDVIARATRQSHFVSVFGEMVALLCAENNSSAAIQLEQLWNDLARTYRFSLCCAYPLTAFANDSEGSALLQVCAEHSLALPAEDPL
jgi:MEDS: MEthanogen/methylotroph, DcmR Sensory domain